MKKFIISGHFTVGDLTMKPGPEREERIMTVMRILREGLAACKAHGTVEDFSVGRQIRPWNETRRDGLPEPDVVEHIEIIGPDPSEVFERYHHDPSHVELLKKLNALGQVTWQVVLSEE